METIDWMAGKLRQDTSVLDVAVLSNYLLRIEREKLPPFVAGVLSQKCVSAEAIRRVLDTTHVVDIIVNIPRESYWEGGALKLASNRHVAVGSFGDLFNVINNPSVRDYVPKEVHFIERGLSQHTQISKYERLFDKVYRIRTKKGAEIVVAMLNEYELTADHVRTSRDRYGQFDYVVITHPHGGATESAESVAKSLEIKVMTWREFYGHVNRK